MVEIKQELEGVISELRTDVEEKGTKIAEDRKEQEEGFEKLNNEIKEIREEFKLEGEFDMIFSFIISYFFTVRESKDHALEMQKALRDEILGKLEDTNKNIEQVQKLICRLMGDITMWQVGGDLVSGLAEVTSKLGEGEDRQEGRIAELGTSLGVGLGLWQEEKQEQQEQQELQESAESVI